MIRSLLTVLPTLVAATSDVPRPAVLDALTSCRAIVADAERLACYDRAAAALNAQVERKEVIVLDQQEVKKTKRSLFGFTLPRIGIFGGGGNGPGHEDTEFTQIETTVTSVRGTGYGKLRFTIEDGAVWQTTEPSPAEPKPGTKVTIKRAALGSYFIKFEGERTIKGMRIG